MAELLSSVEAVLGKPERKTAAEPAPAKPAKEAKPEPVPADPRKIEKDKPVEGDFAWAADLEKMRREIPKTTVRAPSRQEPSLEARLDTIANELLSAVGVESAPHHKAVEDKPQERAEQKGNGNGNGNGNVDIDQFLKSALAGLDLKKEKVKVPKTAPLPPPPPAERPRPVPPPVIVKPQPAPIAPPAVAEKTTAAFSRPAEPAPSVTLAPPAPSVTLTPGDPGSDASPFFMPDKKKTEKPVERPRTPAHHHASKRPKAEEMAVPAKPGTKAREAEVISSSQILSEIFGDKPKKSVSPLLAVGAGIVVIAALGFFILRPKRPAAPADNVLKPPQTVTQSSVAEKPAEQVPPPEANPKPAAPKPKVETQTRVADIGPSSEDAILLPVAPAGAPSTIGDQILPGDKGQGQNAEVSQAVQTDPPPVKTEESAPPAKTEETPTQGTAGDTGAAADPGTAAATAAKPQVNEGDLVDLASVAEPPRALKTVDPVYPSSAQRLGVEGSITVNALIDEKGNVIDTGILKGIQDDNGLGKAAETAVKKWKFQPAKKGGVNVKVWKPFIIVFKTAAKIS
jgi:protein TonB